jgi:soluble lytic murein transglycosylase-like protein
MTKAKIAAAILAWVSWLTLSGSCNAQITTAIDQSGKLVFINADSRNAGSHAARSRSTISSPAATPNDAVAVQQAPAAAEPSPRWPALPAPSAPQSVLPATATAPEASPLLAGTESRLDRIVREAAERNQMDPALVKAVISTESGWNPNAISRKGAVGLMQLIPETAQRYGVNNRFDPAQNVEGGTKYLKSLLARYNGDLTKSLAAYNAGERNVDLSGGVPPIPETQKYVQKVTDRYFQPGSGRNADLWSPPRPPVRREVDSNGRVVFTNE